MNLNDQADSFVCDTGQPRGDVERHLQMIEHKRKRCQEWVSSQLAEDYKSTETSGYPEDQELDKISEEPSDSELNNDYINDDEGNTKRKCKITFEENSLKLKCEWKGCGCRDANNLRLFSLHVSSHIEEVLLDYQNSEQGTYVCLWESCFFETADGREITRHIHYHAYHTNLKATAIRINHLWKFSFCKLDQDSRNCLPDLLSPFNCEWSDCDFIHDNFQKFIAHVNEHSYEFENTTKKDLHSCKWRGCLSTFTKVTCKVHLRKHSNEKVVACPTCGVMFTTNTKYMDHCIRKLSTKIENNRCKYCWRYYANVRLLRDHMRYHINQYKCPFCEMTCSKPSRLASHIQYCHLNERHFKCLICSFAAKTIDDYNSHLIIHDAEHKVQCKFEGCEYSCKRRYALKRHYLKVHEQNQYNYVCHLCDKVYTRGYILTTHLQKVHNIPKPAGNSRFRYMQNLNGDWQLQTERYESIEPQNNSQLTELKVDLQNALNYVVTSIKSAETYKVTMMECNRENTVEYEATDYQANKKLIALEEVDESGSIIRSQLIRENTAYDVPKDGQIIAEM